MLIRDARARLTWMLADRGLTPGGTVGADPRAMIEVYRRFAAIPANDAAPADQDGDGTLAQFGTYEFRGTLEFSAGFTRQFLGPGDEDPPMWQLSCTLYWDSNPETDVLASGHLWSFGTTLTAFFAQAVTLPGWAWALSGSQRPQDLEVAMEQV
jgi:hypothetical protein